MTMFPEITGVLIEHITVADKITLVGRTTSPTASCPSCGTNSSRVQSRYTRKLHDLPSSGRVVHPILQVRRFFCDKNTCAQKMFAECLPELCHPHAQRTIRLQGALCQLGLALGGQAGADVGEDLGLSVSRDTILRLMRHHPFDATSFAESAKKTRATFLSGTPTFRLYSVHDPIKPVHNKRVAILRHPAFQAGCRICGTILKKRTPDSQLDDTFILVLFEPNLPSPR